VLAEERSRLPKMELKKSPIELWQNLIGNNNSYVKNKDYLKQIFIDYPPKYAEIVTNSSCPNQCQHCAYPPDYPIYNKNLNEKIWLNIIDYLYKIKIRKFIFSGRTIDDKVINIIKYINEKYPDSHVGLIADGPAIKKYSNKLNKIKLNHLDISIDGLKETHDLQRNFSGSFDTTIEQIKKLINKDGLLKKDKIEKISILSTLTKINQKEIMPMIKYLNKEFKIKNFFISPIEVCEEANFPDKNLKLSKKEFSKFIKSLIKEYKNLDNIYLALNVYDEAFINFLEKELPKIYKNLKLKSDYLEYKESFGNNDFFISIFPVAINFCRELIINSDGTLFTGFTQSFGKIPNKYIFGNILDFIKENKTTLDEFSQKEAFNFYVSYVLKMQKNKLKF
jgi:MoaA/NifB/PqqE/SkfB family radical SAM enzyme